jgi:8-amino-3,8-dideoxy-alpha-D-manno-octulosonate transaminase
LTVNAWPMFPGATAMGQAEERAVLEVIRNRRLFRYYGIGPGPSQVTAFEHAFARRMGVRHALAVSSGTAALGCALVGAGLKGGDEVILPAYGFVAVPQAVRAVGAVPVLAEVDRSLTLDPRDVVRRITGRTRAIVGIHMRGAPAALSELTRIARRHRLVLIEDVAQACGGSYRGRMLGSWGRVATFSFQFNKILTTGEGGMVVTDDTEIWRRARAHHDPVSAFREPDVAASGTDSPPSVPGQNYRASEFIGALGMVQLRRVDGLVARMRRLKVRLQAELGEATGLRPRLLHDPAGDTAIACIFFLRSPRQAARFAVSARERGVPAQLLDREGRVDLHVHSYWSCLDPRARAGQRGGPAGHATLALLRRAVHVDVSPLMSLPDAARLGRSLRQAAQEVASR